MKQVFSLFFFCISFYYNAQQWIRTYGQGYWANWVIEDYDKGYIILGTKTINAGYSIVIKTDTGGNKLWSCIYGKNSFRSVTLFL